MRYLTTALVLSLLASCGGGGGGGGGGGSAAFPSVVVNGTSITATVAHAGTYDVVVNGTGNTVSTALGQTIRNMSVQGIDNDVAIGSSSTVSGTVTLSGINAVLHLPPGSPIAVNITGLGSTVVYDSAGG